MCDSGDQLLFVVNSATRLTHNFLATNVNILKRKNLGLFLSYVSDSRFRGCTKFFIIQLCAVNIFHRFQNHVACSFCHAKCTVITIHDYLISPRCQSSCVKSLIDQSQTGNDLIFFVKYRKKFIATASNFCNVFY